MQEWKGQSKFSMLINEKKNGKKNYYNDTIDVGWITTGKWFKTMWDFFTSYKIFKNRQK